MHRSAAAYQVGGMKEVIILFNIHSQHTVGLSNTCVVIGSQSKHQHLNTLPIPHFITWITTWKKREAHN
jgi:hypothetical protein